MKKLLKYLKNFKKECIVAPSFKMLEALFELFVPLFMTKIIDEGITLHNKTTVYKNGAIIVAFGLIGLTCSLTAQYFAAKAATGFSKGVRKALFDRIMDFSFENLDKQGSSTLITRITNDLNQVQNGVNMVLRLLLRSPFIVFGAMIMAFTINVKAALIFVVMIPLLFIVVLSITIISIPMYKKIQKSLDRLTGHIRENLSGARVIRAFNTEEREKEIFEKENTFLYDYSLVTSRVSVIMNPLTVIIVNVSMLVLILKGANLVNDGTLTNGQVYALVNYMSQILVELVKLSNLMITINKALASAQRISDTLLVETTQKDTGVIDAKDLLSGDIKVEFSNVNFAYPGTGKEFIENVSFSMESGETIGIIGGTGSGKSTLAKLLQRFYDVSSGDILINGHSISEYSLKSLNALFGYVPQKALLFSGQLKENLLLANPEASEEDMLWAVKMSESENILEAKGEGLSFEIKEGGNNLSGGQKQRLTIARALTKKAGIFIFDDSSSALDYHTDKKLRDNLRTLPKNTIRIIISQRVISIKDADRIAVMDDGKLVGFDTHERLMNSCPVYREICESQGEAETL